LYRILRRFLAIGMRHGFVAEKVDKPISRKIEKMKPIQFSELFFEEIIPNKSPI